MGLIETSSDAELLEDLFALALAAKTLEEFQGNAVSAGMICEG